jgi:hypothetical protein
MLIENTPHDCLHGEDWGTVKTDIKSIKDNCLAVQKRKAAPYFWITICVSVLGLLAGMIYFASSSPAAVLNQHEKANAVAFTAQGERIGRVETEVYDLRTSVDENSAYIRENNQLLKEIKTEVSSKGGK